MIKNAKRRKKGQIDTIADLHPDPRNARRHTPRNVGAIVNALNTVGAARSIVIDEDGTILAGNATVRAAGEAGIQKVQVVESDGKTLVAVRRSGLTAKEKASLAILDNRASELAEWDEPQLASLVADFDLNVSDLAFDQAEFDLLIGKEPPAIVEDELPSNVPQRCACGDLWQLGEHRLLCGDSTKAEDVGRLMAGAKASLCFTSPPYAQQRDYDNGGVGDWDALMCGVFANLPMADDGQVLVNLGLVHKDGEWQPYWDAWIGWMREQGWRRFGWYVWDQGHGLMGDWNGRLAPSHEFVFHFNRQAVRPLKWIDCKPESLDRADTKRAAAANGKSVPGQRGSDGVVKEMYSLDKCGQSTKVPDSVLRITREQARGMHTENHPAVFPVALPAFHMQSWPGECYEPFCGSGTTIIAAEQLNRRCFGIEISPKYCDVILARWEKFTGKTSEKVDV